MSLRSPLSSLALVAAILFSWGCADDTATTIDRETFIDVYVEIRVAALGTEDATLLPADRDRILESYAVSVDDLVEFAEVHGEDPTFMQEVWNDIESRLNVDSISTS